MALIKWRSQLEIGVPEIDADHKQLVHYVNELSDAVLAGESRKVVGRILMNLIQYTNEHFEREEKVMAAVEYPKMQGHIKEHERLKQQVQVEAARFVSNKSETVGQEVLDFLAEWLCHHIVGMDRPLAEYCKAKSVWL